MATRSGPFKTLRSAATYAANDTWYECTDSITMGRGANCLRLYITAAVASPGNVDFYVKHSTDSSTFFDFSDGGVSPTVWGSLVFSAVGTKSIELVGLNMPPNEEVKVFFRASAGAASATLAVQALAFESGYSPGAFTDVSVSGSQIEVEAKNKVAVTEATGAVAINTTTAVADNFKLESITVHFGAAPTTSEDLVVTLDAADGAAYDTVLARVDPSVDSLTDITFHGGLDFPGHFESGDEIVVTYTNTDTETYGLRIVTRVD